MVTTDSVEFGIQSAVMSIRQSLMFICHGSCLDSFGIQSSVRVDDLSGGWPSSNRKYRFLIGGAPLLDASKTTVTFHNAVLNRSPQFKQIKTQLQAFLAEYLPKVEVKENNNAAI